MASMKIWLQASRLRTLPLAASGILCGAALAWFSGRFSWSLSALALLTALLLQVLSNFANDYGDAEKGTDNEHRVGPQRTVQSGALSLLMMKRGMLIMAVFAFLSGLALVTMATATATLPKGAWLFFLILGFLSISAAIFYTVGKRAYGYHGLGDLMVFFFFGIVSVSGTYYLNTGQLTFEVCLLAIAVGFLSTGVLNLNNMRDMDNDITSGKMTLAAHLGYKKARFYHRLLVGGGIGLFAFLIIYLETDWIGVALMIFPMYILGRDSRTITKIEDKSLLDPFLKKLSLATFMLSLAFIFALVISHSLQ